MIVNIKKIIYKFIFLSPLWLSILTLIKIKFIFVFIFMALFVLFINFDYIKRKKIIDLILYDFLVVFNLIYGTLKLNNINYFQEYDFVTYTLLISFLLYWSNKDNINRNSEILSTMKNVPKINAIVTFVLLIYSLIIGVGFISKHQTIIFIGVYGLEHELAYHLLCSYALMMYGEQAFGYNKIFSNLFKIIFAFFILLTGVRTALLILIILFLVDFKQMKFKYKFLICLLACISFAFISSNSALLEKIPLVSKSSISGEAGDVTNGRFVMSERGINYYLNKTSSKEKIFGITMTNIRQNVFWDGLHAHNDFVNILLGFGIINLLYFIYLLLKIKKETSMIFLLLIVVTAGLNGLFMYYEFVLSIPLFINLMKRGREDVGRLS